MTTDSGPSPARQIQDLYKKMVSAKHPAELGSWPVLSGADIVIGGYKGWGIFHLKHTGNPVMTAQSGLGEMPLVAVGVEEITNANREAVRERLYRHFRAKPDDAVLLVEPTGMLADTELTTLLARHEAALGLAPMKIFLSHKSPDKTLVRDFKATLELLGFDPWLDEDAMAAGAQLDRSILQGMKDSCAAVFFLTPNFADEAYLASEINYAIQEQRSRPEKFSIVTLVLPEGGNKPEVPGLLRPFVWKEPTTHLIALREIVRALPVKVGDVRWR